MPAIASVIALFLLCGSASAQEDVSSSTSAAWLNAQTYEPSGLASGFLGVPTARVLPVLKPSIEVLVNWGYKPLQRARTNGAELRYADGVIDHLTSLHLRAAVSPVQWFQIGLSAPILQLAATGGGVGTDAEAGKTLLGVGDVRLDLDFVPISEDSGIGLLITPFVTAPSGSRQLYLTHGVPTFGVRAALSGTAGMVHLAGNVGYAVKPGAVAFQDAVTADDQLTYGAGLGFEVHPLFRLNLEGRGQTIVGPGLSQITKDLLTARLHTGFEAGGGLRMLTPDGFGVNVGAMAGTTPALGSPTVRVLFGMGYAPMGDGDLDGDGIGDSIDACKTEPEDIDGFKDEDGCPDLDDDADGIPDLVDACPRSPEDFDDLMDEDGCPESDADDDGVLDLRDSCPLSPEDLDDFEDDDGCPDHDNDHDRVTDRHDDCPLDPEDRDGFEDADGCPDRDNDGDGIPDDRDACPLRAEDFDGFADSDGCPEEEQDRDADGIFDLRDACPGEPEDFDGFDDTDGCPDLDNDGDGLLDLEDLCPNRPEEFNDYLDEDGCPDEVKAVLQGDRILILQKVFFFLNDDRIRPESFGVLDAVFETLVTHSEVKLIRVEGHTDSQGSDGYNQELSERRASSVRRYLLARGLDPKRVIARGYGETLPLASNRTEEGREINRRVEFYVVPPDEEEAPEE